jgi:hypothetical protein
MSDHEDECSFCIICMEYTDDTCGCTEAMNRYGCVQCVFCNIYFSDCVSADVSWPAPCEKCHELYRADYTAANPEPEPEASSQKEEKAAEKK